MKIGDASVQSWADKINALNKKESEIQDTRYEEYSWLSKKIQTIFKHHLHKDVKVVYSSDGGLIKVEVPIFMDESVRITQELLDDLSMPVSVGFDNARCMIFELYAGVKIPDKDNFESQNVTADNMETIDCIPEDEDIETIGSILKEGGYNSGLS